MPRVRLPSLAALRAFEAAARRLSFTDAAREMHVSQAAISRHVRVLEQNVGRALFRRLHRRVELTQSGRQLAGHLSAAFERIHHAVEVIRRSPNRIFRITAEPAFAARWLVPRLGDFSLLHPDIEIDLETTDQMRVLSRDADVAIRYLRAGTRMRQRKAVHLMDVDGVPMIAGLKRTAAEPAADRKVLDYRLLHDDGGAEWKMWFAAAGISGYERLKHLRFSDHSLALEAARRGQGVVLGTPTLIESELASGELTVIGRTRIPLGQYWLLQASERSTAEARAVFARWLVKQLC